MRTGGTDFVDAAAISDGETGILDWLNLPPGTQPTSLWNSLHDAHVVSIHSSLLERTLALSCEIQHLRCFHKLNEGFEFILKLEGVQSARVSRYAVWPGAFSVSGAVSRQEESRLIAEYQAKWREESASWADFEASVTREGEQVFDISDAAVAVFGEGALALRICGHLNYGTYHEVFLRADRLSISGNDGKEFKMEEFEKLGEAYWEAFSRRSKSKQ
jgi:hypothetical protein